jgi:hypothetical protein
VIISTSHQATINTSPVSRSAELTNLGEVVLCKDCFAHFYGTEIKRDRMEYLHLKFGLDQLEDVIQEINQYTMGWIGYYRQANTPKVFEELDSWVRRKLRQMVWKRWKRGRKRYQELVKLGVPRWQAQAGAGGKSPWRMASTPVVQMALNNTYWKGLGLKSLKDRYKNCVLLDEPPDADPHVRW